MTAAIFRHTGHWDADTRQNRALRFVESYAEELSSDLALPFSPTKYFSPSCTFYDTSNVTYRGFREIKAWMQRLFTPFDKLDFTGLSFLVVDESGRGLGPNYTVIAEFIGNHYFKGDPEPIVVPRLMVFTLAESETDDGFDGLQYVDVKLYWNTALVKDEKMKRDQAAA
jgi:hypothetical protein